MPKIKKEHLLFELTALTLTLEKVNLKLDNLTKEISNLKAEIKESQTAEHAAQLNQKDNHPPPINSKLGVTAIAKALTDGLIPKQKVNTDNVYSALICAGLIYKVSNYSNSKIFRLTEKGKIHGEYDKNWRGKTLDQDLNSPYFRARIIWDKSVIKMLVPYFKAR